MHIPPEPPAIIEDMRPPDSWPSHGRIELVDLKERYRPNAPLILKGISCTFKVGTRVGVVGRTESGKTTLISTLFRLVEPETTIFCFGRILLKRSRIVLLDEATASIDSATDATLQRIIREKFTGCTVITMAHRVPTITDSDMMMVLSYGEVVEYDEPSKLMESNSAFDNLVSEYWSSNRELKNF
ncbi:hypothetical protein Patl1_33341 [Pistacia atlantica]|uniref:Uncharacterized protein n=1 Tax=Pistacia atlantica TaxID=434234 RepID=A0ACC0ZS49_9ROSI|nr:hypothetical protein Patl1_33341 [Pistacia atlantica]